MKIYFYKDKTTSTGWSYRGMEICCMESKERYRKARRLSDIIDWGYFFAEGKTIHDFRLIKRNFGTCGTCKRPLDPSDTFGIIVDECEFCGSPVKFIETKKNEYLGEIIPKEVECRDILKNHYEKLIEIFGTGNRKATTTHKPKKSSLKMFFNKNI